MPSCWPSSRLQLKTSPDFDVASAVFEAAVDAQVPDARAILSLKGLLRARRPTPGWVEILTLHRLAERALAIIQGKRPEESWKPETVRKLLGVVKAGERHAPAPILPSGPVPG